LVKIPDMGSSVATWWQQELTGLPKKLRRTKAALLMYTAWNLWKERNQRIFEHNRAIATRVFQEIKAEILIRKLAVGGPVVPSDPC